MGVTFNDPELILGHNLSIGLNISDPSNVFKEQHNIISYHWAREAIEAKVLRFIYNKNEENFSDILAKLLGNQEFIILPRIYFLYFRRSYITLVISCIFMTHFRIRCLHVLGGC
jgi:hypothetical protein